VVGMDTTRRIPAHAHHPEPRVVAVVRYRTIVADPPWGHLVQRGPQPRGDARMTLIRDFLDYWSPKRIAARLDLWTQRFRAATGRDPDPKVEQRIAERDKREEDA
jgi:hypothetical protein